MLFNETRLSVVLDFDGCTSTEEAQNRLIAHLIGLVKSSPNVTGLDISIGSTRGLSFYQDFHSSYLHATQHKRPHASCAALGLEFMSKLELGFKNENPGISIAFDPLLIGDVLNYLSVGRSFQLMSIYKNAYADWSEGKVNISLGRGEGSLMDLWVRPNLEGGVSYSADNIFCNDEYKILLMYMQMHYKAQQNPGEKFVLDFYDDRVDILGAIHDFYSVHPELIPSNCCLRINQFYVENYYDAQYVPQEPRVVVGEGGVNQFFDKSVRAVVRQHNKKADVTCLSKAEQQQKELALMQDCILAVHHAPALELSTFGLGVFKRSATSSNLAGSDKENNPEPKKSKIT